MQGRIAGLKKTYLLRAVAFTALISFICGTIISVKTLKLPSLWFFNFCLSIGFFELIKGFLFKLDSSIYIGAHTFFIGISGFIFLITKTTDYAIFYISASSILASVATYFLCGQKFQLVVAYSTFFVALYGFLLKKSLINMSIFIAFASAFLLLLILIITINFKRRK